LTPLAARSAVLAAVENRLRGFYQAAAANFGRAILRSEIIAVIEGTEGVDRIETAPNAPIIASPVADARLLVWEMPRLVNVTLRIAE
jgi:phage-related baseplate assembly protein